jgi:hypothetical protein
VCEGFPHLIAAVDCNIETPLPVTQKGQEEVQGQQIRLILGRKDISKESQQINHSQY